MNIGGRLVGPGEPCYIVAELGINHDGNLWQALQMVRAAKDAGADAVKVQAFSPECFVSKHATYKGESQEALFSRYVLDGADIRAIAHECIEQDITFFGTPDCVAHAQLLLDLDAPCLKVGSDDLTNLPLIRTFAGMGVPLILSTGMGDLAEIHAAAQAAQQGGPEAYAMLHCVSLYPTPFSLANLTAIPAMLDYYVHVGYSDHTDGVAASVAAVTLGAQIIEKHLTLDRTLAGPDHAFSADPTQFSAMVRGIREIETLLTVQPDKLSDEEKAMRLVARRSIRSRFDCKEGTLLTRGHLVFQRPGDGLSPARLDDVLGKYLRVAKSAGDTIGVDEVR